MKTLFIILAGSLTLCTCLSASVNNTIRVDVDTLVQISTAPDLYNVGYNGWGDITSPVAIRHLNGVNVKYCRIIAELSKLCGDKPGDYNWDYITPPDVGLGFTNRVKKIISNGWIPIIAFSLHSGTPDLPKWFHGENNDLSGKAWFRYNLDGNMAQDDISDQYTALSEITNAAVKHFADNGLTGLHWETIYEMGPEMPIADIHYYAAKGIRDADKTAKIIGPATWPGWSVEERFVKPFLSKYDADLVDYVSVHWYASNDQDLWAKGFDPAETIMTMKDRVFTEHMLSKTPDFAEWTRTLRDMLDNPDINKSGKHIGIMYTEFDAVAQSPYEKNPENPIWPNYDEGSDCYINTNYYGGVWCASVLCNMAAYGKADVFCKFNTRNYYGLIENGKNKNFYRTPVWFAWKLLQDKAGLNSGAEMVKSTSDNSGTVLEHYAVKADDGVNLIFINKSQSAFMVDAFVSGLNDCSHSAEKYIFNQERTAAFIGRKPGSKLEGQFEGAPYTDIKNNMSLKPIADVKTSSYDGKLLLSDIECPKISVVVIRIKEAN